MIVNEIYVERRQLHPATTLSRDLADHLYSRPPDTKTIVLTRNPSELMGVVIKRWNKIERQLRKEQSSTLNAARRRQLALETAWASKLMFSTKPEYYTADGVASFIPESLAFDLPAACQTLYITRPVYEPSLELLARSVFYHGLIVIYE